MKDLSTKNRYLQNMEAHLVSHPKSPSSDWSFLSSRGHRHCWQEYTQILTFSNLTLQRERARTLHFY